MLVLKFLFIFFFFISITKAEDISTYENQSKIAIKVLGKSLKEALISIIGESGPIEAIEYCNITALNLTEDISLENKLILKRTSLKYRNNMNAPDAWETSVLENFEKRKLNGENINSINQTSIIYEEKVSYFRFMQAIPVLKPCMTCHGSNIRPDIEAKIYQLYPNDMAKNFKVGDIRGAFSVKVLLNN